MTFIVFLFTAFPLFLLELSFLIKCILGPLTFFLCIGAVFTFNLLIATAIILASLHHKLISKREFSLRDELDITDIPFYMIFPTVTVKKFDYVFESKFNAFYSYLESLVATYKESLNDAPFVICSASSKCNSESCKHKQAHKQFEKCRTSRCDLIGDTCSCLPIDVFINQEVESKVKIALEKQSKPKQTNKK